MAAKNYALRNSLEGAPNTPHTIAGVPGFFRYDPPTPVGEGCPVSLERARELDKDKGCPLELVELSEKDLTAATEAAEADVDASRRNLREAAQVANGAEVARVSDEAKAAKSAAK